MTKSNKGKSNGRPKPTIALVAKALNEAAQDAVEVHRRANQPLAVWKDGKTVLVPPESVKSTQQPKPRRRKSS